MKSLGSSMATRITGFFISDSNIKVSGGKMFPLNSLMVIGVVINRSYIKKQSMLTGSSIVQMKHQQNKYIK